MAILLHCAKCKAKLKASDKVAGSTVACPKCKAPILIPETGAEQLDVVFEEVDSESTNRQDDAMKAKEQQRSAMLQSPLVLIGCGATVVVLLVAAWSYYIWSKSAMASWSVPGSYDDDIKKCVYYIIWGGVESQWHRPTSIVLHPPHSGGDYICTFEVEYPNGDNATCLYSGQLRVKKNDNVPSRAGYKYSGGVSIDKEGTRTVSVPGGSDYYAMFVMECDPRVRRGKMAHAGQIFTERDPNIDGVPKGFFQKAAEIRRYGHSEHFFDFDQ